MQHLLNFELEAKGALCSELIIFGHHFHPFPFFSFSLVVGCKTLQLSKALEKSITTTSVCLALGGLINEVCKKFKELRFTRHVFARTVRIVRDRVCHYPLSDASLMLPIMMCSRILLYIQVSETGL